ncbi:MAG: FkbM family methyltransferase [Bacteroidales bacterium]|nr:FkbM family methyltransferase [Bacteroidales bacterium]
MLLLKKNKDFFYHIINKHKIDFDNQFIYVMDIGANKGTFYFQIKNIFKKKIIKAHLVEPLDSCFGYLIDKFKDNENIIISKEALSQSQEKTNFHIYSFDETSSLLNLLNIKEIKDLDIHEVKTISILTNTLDNICNFDFVDFLKIDTQGTEDKILKGGLKTIKKTRYIWIEVSFKQLYKGSCLFNDIYSLLVEQGFILLEIVEGHRSANKELLQANCLFKNINL